MHVTIIYGCCGQSSKADIVVDIMVFAVEPVTNHLFSAPGTLMMARNGTGVITTWFHIRMVLMGKWTKRLGKLDHTFHDSILEILRLERINYFLWTNKKKNLNFKTILWYKIILQKIFVVHGAFLVHNISDLLIHMLSRARGDHCGTQNSGTLNTLGIHRWLVNPPHKWPVTEKSFHLMTSSWWCVSAFTLWLKSLMELTYWYGHYEFCL